MTVTHPGESRFTASLRRSVSDRLRVPGWIVRDRMRVEGVDARLGGIARLMTVADVVENFSA